MTRAHAIIPLVFSLVGCVPSGTTTFGGGIPSCEGESTDSVTEVFADMPVDALLEQFPQAAADRTDAPGSVQVAFTRTGDAVLSEVSPEAIPECQDMFPQLTVNGRWTLHIDGTFDDSWLGVGVLGPDAMQLHGSAHGPDIRLAGDEPTPEAPAVEWGRIDVSILASGDGPSTTGYAERTWVIDDDAEGLIEEVARW